MPFAKILLFLLILVFASFIKKTRQLSAAEFQGNISAYGLSFNMPPGYRSVPVQENEDFKYDFAIRSKKEQTEIRYSLYPFSTYAEAYRICSNSAVCLLPAPDKQFAEMFHSTLGALNGGPAYDIKPLTDSCCKKQLGADTGGYCNLVWRKHRRYNFLQVVHFRKKENVDVVMQVLRSGSIMKGDPSSAVLNTLKFNH